MEENSILDFSRRGQFVDPLTDLLRLGAQNLIATAVEAELALFLEQFSIERTPAGHAVSIVI